MIYCRDIHNIRKTFCRLRSTTQVIRSCDEEPDWISTLRQASSPSALMASTTAVLQQRAEVTHRGSLDADLQAELKH